MKTDPITPAPSDSRTPGLSHSRTSSSRTLALIRHPAAALLSAIVLLLALFAIWVPGGRFLTTSNLLDLAQQISVNAIIAFGMTLVILIGGIDLSVGAV